MAELPPGCVTLKDVRAGTARRRNYSRDKKASLQPRSVRSTYRSESTLSSARTALEKEKVTDKFTESMYILANEPSVALYRLQEHVRRSLPELAQHKADMQSWEEQSQGAIYTVEYACSAIKNMKDSSVYFKSIEGLLRHAIAVKDQLNSLRR